MVFYNLLNAISPTQLWPTLKMSSTLGEPMTTSRLLEHLSTDLLHKILLKEVLKVLTRIFSIHFKQINSLLLVNSLISSSDFKVSWSKRILIHLMHFLVKIPGMPFVPFLFFFYFFLIIKWNKFNIQFICAVSSPAAVQTTVL